VTYTLYLLSLVISAALAAALAFYFSRRHPMPGAVPASLMMLAVTVISLGYILQYRSTGLSGQIFATNIQYVGIATLPLAWFTFSLRYTGRDQWLTRRNLLLLAIIPLATIVLAWTNGIDGLIWQDRHLDTNGPFNTIAKTYGLWFWVYGTYSYTLIAIGTLILIQRLFRPPRVYREQSIAVVICVVVPLVWNVIYIFKLVPMFRVDLTPSAFVISGLAIAWGLFRYQFFNIIPIARDTVIEDMSDGVIVLDTHNRFIDLNLSAQRIIGYSLSDVIGQSLSRVLSGQPELVERSNIGVATANVEITIKRGETQRYYESSISPIYDRQSRLTGRLVILHDITERRLIEAEKKDLEEKAQLASRLSIIGEMAAGVAHEVNNPLTSVIGYADWLLQHDIPDEIRKDIEVINTQATRASEILDRLLTFAGHHVVNRDHVDINRVIETTIELRSHSLAKNNIEIIYQFAPDLPKTMADGGQLQQVFLNLIINAETSIAEAHDKGMLMVKTETFDNHIRVSIKDDGLGITEENLTKIFQPFFSTRETGKGTGLGLSICHGIISKHNGRIYVESEFGYGATFIVELPIAVQ